jgi:hypothetical protein
VVGCLKVFSSNLSRNALKCSESYAALLTLRSGYETLATTDPSRLASFRREYDAVAAEYFNDNAVQQGYIMTRAIKN